MAKITSPGNPFQRLVVSSIEATLPPFEIEHYAGQGGGNSPDAFVIHDYSDSKRTVQLDRVGGDQGNQDFILGLRNAGNGIRRPDKDGGYVGGAGFIEATNDKWTVGANFTGTLVGDQLTVADFVGSALAIGQRITGTGIAEDTKISAFVTGSGGDGVYAVTVRGQPSVQFLGSRPMVSNIKGNDRAWLVNRTGGLTWPVYPGVFSSGKPDGDTQFAFSFIATAETQNLFSFGGYKSSVGSVQTALTGYTDVNSTRVVISTTNAKTSGLRLSTLAGPIALAPLPAAGAIMNPVSIGNGLTLPTYTVAGLANFSPSTYARTIVHCSNGDAGSECLAIAVGGVWKKISIGSVISAT